MPTLDGYCAAKLKELEKAHARRILRAVPEGMASFANNDYFGLAQHPDVTGAAQAALTTYGAGASASRLVTGNHPLYAPLETKLAQMKKKEAALVFGSGYLANVGTITALVGKGDLILADKLVHACIIDGAQLSGAKLMRFKHNDVDHAIALLQEHRGDYANVLIITEHVFSMDGDKAPLVGLSKLARRHDAWLMVDDAHGLGEEVATTVDIWVGTLSKAYGSYGGYVAGKKSVIEYLATSARSFIFSTGLPPSVCAAALKALEISEKETERRTRPLQLARKVTNALGLAPAQSAIVPVMFGSAEAALAASARLEKLGILAIAIRPPTVPANTARLRLTFSYNHTDEQVDALIAALENGEHRGMSLLALSGWAQPADAVTKALGLQAATAFDYSDYPSPEASFAGLHAFADIAHVIGWSTGGYLALRAIAAGVLKPQKLTLIAAPYQFVADAEFPGGMDPVTYHQFLHNYATDPIRTRQRFHALIARGDSAAKRMLPALEHHPHVDDAARWLPWLQALGAVSLREIDLSDTPATIIIHGSNDAIVSPMQGEMLLQKLPHARLERWEETGHAPHLHDKQRLLALLN